MSRKSLKIIVAAAVFAAVAAYLVFAAAQSSWAYYCSVDELLASQSPSKVVIRLAGTVKDQPPRQDTQTLLTDFVLLGKQNEISVRYKGPLPAAFEPGREIIAEGTLATDGVFNANTIMTRCESKYEAKLK